MKPVKLWSLATLTRRKKKKKEKKRKENDPSYKKSNSEPQEKQGTPFHGDESCLLWQAHNHQGPEHKSKDET